MRERHSVRRQTFWRRLRGTLPKRGRCPARRPIRQSKIIAAEPPLAPGPLAAPGAVQSGAPATPCGGPVDVDAAATCFPANVLGSIIGPLSLNCRVRDGNGCGPQGIAAAKPVRHGSWGGLWGAAGLSPLFFSLFPAARAGRPLGRRRPARGKPMGRLVPLG